MLNVLTPLSVSSISCVYLLRPSYASISCVYLLRPSYASISCVHLVRLSLASILCVCLVSSVLSCVLSISSMLFVSCVPVYAVRLLCCPVLSCVISPRLFCSSPVLCCPTLCLYLVRQTLCVHLVRLSSVFCFLCFLHIFPWWNS